MLDTNTVSHLIMGHAAVARRLVQVPVTSLCLSAITEGELQFGLAKRPAATQLRKAVHEFLQRVEVLAWDSGVAQAYGHMQARLSASGKTLGPLDALIAAHAIATGSILVTNDSAFSMANGLGLKLEDWTKSE
jgi:tRNA(fMet)-specific endonuclease VapC